MNLTSQPSFRSDIRKWVEQSIYIRISVAFAGSMNRALHSIQNMYVQCNCAYVYFVLLFFFKTLFIKLKKYYIQVTSQTNINTSQKQFVTACMQTKLRLAEICKAAFSG